MAHKWAELRCHPCCRVGVPNASVRGPKSELAHKWADWLCHPCRLGGPQCLTAGDKIRTGPQVGGMATSPLPTRGSPTPQSGSQNQKWPMSGRISYVSPAVMGVPNASKRGTKSEVAHKWADWLCHPRRLGWSPMLWSGGQNQKWPTSGRINYVTPAVWGGPNA